MQLASQIEHLRLRLQRRRLAAAACWAIATLVATALGLTACDRLLGVGDFWGRTLLTAAFASVCFLVGRHGFRTVLRQPVEAMDVARRIERHCPELRDLVTSALEFCQQVHDDRLAGSESLRRAVVVCTAVELEAIDWQQLVPRRPLRRAMSAAGAALLVIGLANWWTPQSLGIGLSRLLNPFSDSAWPRTFHLEFVSAPRTLAAGDDLVLQLRDTQGPLPETVEMHYRIWRNHRWHEQIISLPTKGNTLEILRPHVQQSLEFRVTGGDHQTMPWQELKVVAPPQVQEVQIMVHPPDYTGLPSSLLGKNGQVLVGSGLQLSGTCDQRLTGVVLRGESKLVISATLASSGKQFSISRDLWQAESSDLLSLELTTMRGLSTRATWHQAIDVVPDQAPEVQIVEPTASLSVTPAAVVPLVISASDDLAIRDVELLYHRSDRSEQGDQAISLRKGPPQSSVSNSVRQQRLEYLWQLETLSLLPGCVVEVHARASDYHASVGQTRYPLRLRVVALENLLRDISAEEFELLSVLKRLLKEQRELLELVTQWEQKQDPPRPRWLEAFREVSSRQRHLTAALADSRYGLLRAIEKLKDVYSRNQLDRHAALDQLQTLYELLRGLVEKPLQDIHRQLAELMRPATRPETTDIAALAKHQQAVIATLQQAIETLSRENELARFESVLAQLEARQRELAELSQREILDSLSPPDGRRLHLQTGHQASSQQSQLSRRFAKLVMQMSRAIENLSINSANLSDTVSLARDLGVQAAMRAAADHLARQQFGKASALQQKSIDHLHQLRDRLAHGNMSEKNEGEVNTLGTEEQKNPSLVDSSNQPEGSGQAGTKPHDSAASSAQRRPRVSLEVPAQLVKDLWGNLPSRQREKILQPFRETFLPAYAEEIQAYFRDLAEPNGRIKDAP